MSVRSRLYTYGAGSWCGTPLGPLVVEARTQRAGVVSEAGFTPLLDTSGDDGTRLGDLATVPGTTWAVAVREDHDAPGAKRCLVALDAATGSVAELAATDGFLAEPAVSQDASRLAWLTWPARSMPWDAAELWVAALVFHAGRPALAAQRRVDGGRGTSVGQAVWLADGSLAYVGEAAGFWQPWACDEGGVVRRLCARRAEFQRPRWTACRWLAALDGAALACAFVQHGREHVGVLRDGDLEVLDQPCVRIDGLAAHGKLLAWVGATPDAQGGVFMASRLAASPGAGAASPLVALVERAVPVVVPPVAEHFTFEHEGVRLEGAYWAPKRRVFGTTAPPLVLTVHPGPTGAIDTSYAPLTHLLSEAGFAVASIDFSGSTGHGRVHRERLLGRFGDLDVRECVAAVRHLVATDRAAHDATFIRGTSSGGTAALLALCEGAVRGAVAWYPASSFDDEADGFEAGYLDALVGSAEARAARSPLARAPAMRGSVLVIQGAEDPVVGIDETRTLIAALRASLEDVGYVEVPGEGHGFRTAAGRTVALEAELAFYQRLTLPGRGAPDRYDAGTAT